jgi:DNA-binding NtrC family response regulator
LLKLSEASLEATRLGKRAELERRELGERYDLCGLVYTSRAMHDVVSLAVRVAPSDAAVFIAGPNGVGKEKLAEIVQANSRRRDKPFIRVNAGGLPDDLLEAELFGAEAGAYTGATKVRVGRFEAAHGGTLFLDELGNLSASGQMKLLRVLQTGEFQRLGSSQTRRSDVRLLSATNADLRREIAQGRFREDLYFRLNVIELNIPPLAERCEDLQALSEHFLQRHATQQPLLLSKAAVDRMLEHDWPGNVRELENRIHRAVLVCGKGPIAPEHLGLDGESQRSSPSEPPPNLTAAAQTPEKMAAAPDETPKATTPLETAERAVVEAALERANGVVSRAAAELGLSRQALYRRMERLGIALERRIR